MIITLTTDFGLSDPFVGIMKGVILEIAPDVRLVDISHGIPSYDVDEAAFVLSTAFSYFPPGTIHVVVVDPGVGSSRRAIAVSALGHVFVAPDNSVVPLAMGMAATGPEMVAHHINNSSLFRPSVSSTFHGRDIFAPVAAHLARGARLESVGPRIVDFMRLPVAERATVLRVDKFGNIVTNLRPERLGKGFAIKLGGLEISKLLSNYEEATPGEFFAIEGSAGYIEVSLRQDSAAEKLGVCRGAEIEVETRRPNH